VLLVLLYPTAAWVFDAVILLWWACAAALTLGTWYALRPAGVVLRVLGAGTVACVTVVMAPLLALVAYILSGGDATLDIPVMSMSLR
jgi:small neutral amino acid transporter SnatA (MarC family)